MPKKNMPTDESIKFWFVLEAEGEPDTTQTLAPPTDRVSWSVVALRESIRKWIDVNPDAAWAEITRREMRVCIYQDKERTAPWTIVGEPMSISVERLMGGG